MFKNKVLFLHSTLWLHGPLVCGLQEEESCITISALLSIIYNILARCDKKK